VWSNANTFQAKAPARQERSRHALEDAAPVGPRREVEECPVRAVDERRRLVELQLAHVAESEVEIGVQLPRLREHRRRQVDADHGSPDRARDRRRDPSGPDRELDHRPVRLLRERAVERDVGRHVRRPLVVPLRERLVPAHATILARSAHEKAHEPVQDLSITAGQRATVDGRSRPAGASRD